MLTVERLDFSKEKLFANFRDGLTKSDGKTKNLMDCKDDVIFIWDNKNKKLLTQNVKVLDKDPPVYQELFPTEPPIIDVQFIRVNLTVSKAALWGPNGAAIIDIPKRWGAKGAFQGGKDTIMTRCKSVEERYFTAHSIEIRQVRFHPGSLQDNHILVLTSDNAFRLYELPMDSSDAEGPEFLRTWSLGQHPLNLRGRVPFLVSLGDTAVDFDFAPPVLDENSSARPDNCPDRIVWPAVILRGNGDVCIMKTSLVSGAVPKLEGPLPIYPPADDNYGVDACSILVMQTVPNIVIVATSSGTVYHSVLLRTPRDEKVPLTTASHGLYVLESVELELGIQLNEEETTYSCPVILHRDPLFRWKYYCTHNTGIHAVLMSFVPQIEEFVEEAGADHFKFHQIPSTVEYLVCTRTDVTPASPILGFAIVKSWNLILSVLSNGDVISIPLKMADVYVARDTGTESVAGDDTTPLKKLLKEPFDQHVKNLLKRNANQPVLKLDKNVELSPQDCLDLVSRTTNILRQEYFAKIELVGDEIEQRASILTALKALQLKELKELEDKMPERQAAAERFAEKYEEVKERHNQIIRRIEAVLIAVKKLEPIESLAEKRMKNELSEVEKKLVVYEKSIKQLKDKLDFQKFEVAEEKSEARKLHLNDNQVDTIKRNLIKCSGEIADLVSTVKSLRRQTNNLLN